MKEQLAALAAAKGIKARWLDEAASTNDEARAETYTHGDIIVAESQSAGRGQQGNRWHSRPGENLTFSVVLEPRFLPAGEQFFLLQAVSVAVADALEAYGLLPSIKWPNDIYLGDSKVAGLLIENDVCGMNLSRTIVGIGLNVNEPSFPRALPNPTSMSRVSWGRRFDRGEVLARLYENLLSRYAMLEKGRMDRIADAYMRRLYRLGKEAPYATPEGEIFQGIIQTVAPTGELIVEHTPSGELRGYLFKEIEFLRK